MHFENLAIRRSFDCLLCYKHRELALEFLRDQDNGDAQFPRRPPEELAVDQSFKLFSALRLPLE
jgi:hypothetical protein